VDDDKRMTPNVFGKIDRATYPTLYYLNDSMFYFFNMLYRLIKLVGDWPSVSLWKTALSLREAFNVVHYGREPKAEFLEKENKGPGSN
jgi:hypothetical protein